jgi:hypothetical protein
VSYDSKSLRDDSGDEQWLLFAGMQKEATFNEPIVGRI